MRDKGDMKQPKENEWWMCLDEGSVMGLQMVFFYKDDEWWSSATEYYDVKEPFSASKFYMNNFTPLYRMIKE